MSIGRVKECQSIHRLAEKEVVRRQIKLGFDWSSRRPKAKTMVV